MMYRTAVMTIAVLACFSLSCRGAEEHVPREAAYDHVFEVVVLVPDADGARIEIMRLREAEQAVGDPAVTFLPAEGELDAIIEEIASAGEGDYSQSLQATRVDDETWELRLSTGGNTTRDVSTYRTDGRTVEPVRYERHAALSRARRYVYDGGSGGVTAERSAR